MLADRAYELVPDSRNAVKIATGLNVPFLNVYFAAAGRISPTFDPQQQAMGNHTAVSVGTLNSVLTIFLSIAGPHGRANQRRIKPALSVMR